MIYLLPPSLVLCAEAFAFCGPHCGHKAAADLRNWVPLCIPSLWVAGSGCRFLHTYPLWLLELGKCPAQSSLTLLPGVLLRLVETLKPLNYVSKLFICASRLSRLRLLSPLSNQLQLLQTLPFNPRPSTSALSSFSHLPYSASSSGLFCVCLLFAF